MQEEDQAKEVNGKRKGRRLRSSKELPASSAPSIGPVKGRLKKQDSTCIHVSTAPKSADKTKSQENQKQIEKATKGDDLRVTIDITKGNTSGKGPAPVDFPTLEQISTPVQQMENTESSFGVKALTPTAALIHTVDLVTAEETKTDHQGEKEAASVQNGTEEIEGDNESVTRGEPAEYPIGTPKSLLSSSQRKKDEESVAMSETKERQEGEIISKKDEDEKAAAVTQAKEKEDTEKERNRVEKEEEKKERERERNKKK